MRRDHEIRVRVTEDEYDIIKLNAEILDLQLAPYIRTVAQNPNITIYDYAAIRAHTKQVGEIIKSINQLIFTIEINNDYQPKEIDYIVECVEKIMNTECKLLELLRKQWIKDYKKGRK